MSDSEYDHVGPIAEQDGVSMDVDGAGAAAGESVNPLFLFCLSFFFLHSSYVLCNSTSSL